MPPRPTIALVHCLVLAFAAAGCGKTDDAKPGDAPEKKAVEQKGSAAEELYKKGWKGDEKTCGTLKACCTGSSNDLLCDLKQSKVKSDCAKALVEVQKFHRDQISKYKIDPPPGCL